MSFDYYQSVIGKIRKGTADDPFVNVKEPLQVVNSKVVLSELPDKFNRLFVTLPDGTSPLSEIKSGSPTANQYICDYSLGIVLFHESKNGQRFMFNYKGRGAAFIAAERIFTKQMNNEEIVQTLRDILNEADSIINLSERFTNKGAYSPTAVYYGRNIVTYDNASYMCINNNADGIINVPPTDTANWRLIVSVKEIITNAEQATDAANLAAETATTAASNADEKATFAQTEANRAKNLADTFVSKGAYNNTTQYVVNNTVLYNGSTYKCIANSKGILPTDTSKWELIAQAGDTPRAELQAVDGKIGDLTALQTTEKGSLVAAMNEHNVQLGEKATKTELGSGLNLKADTTYVNSELLKKANVTDLSSKTDKTYTDNQLLLKADKSYTDNQLALKADKTYTDNQLSTKREKSVKIPGTELDTSADANKIKMINLSDEVRQAMAGTTPINGSVADGGITLEKLANQAVGLQKLRFAHYDMALTTQDISISSDTNAVMTVTMTDKSTYKNYLYYYEKTGQYKASHQINVEIASYTLNRWQSLVWDLTTNMIQIYDDGTIRPDQSILLVTNSNGNAIEGVLPRFFAAKKAEKMDFTAFANSIEVDAANTIYVYQENGGDVYFRWSGIMRIATRFKHITKNFDQVKADLPSHHIIDSNPEYVKSCIRLQRGYFMAYDADQDKFVINSFSWQSKGNLVIIAENRSGFMGGELGIIATNQAIVFAGLRQNHIKPYYMENIDRKTDEVIMLQNENTFTFGYSTDHHVGEWVNTFPDHAYNVMEKIARELNVDAIFNGGDSIQYGRGQKYYGFGGLKQIANKLSMKDKLYLAIGNHDYNGMSQGTLNPDGKNRRSWTLTPYETYSVLGKFHEKDVVWGSKEGMYYYKDFEDKKIRAIFLNSSDIPQTWINDNDGKEDYLKYDPLSIGGIRQQQATWLANTALNFSNKDDKTEWHTVIVCHIPIFREADGMTWNFPWQRTDAAIRTILTAFIKGQSATAQYTDTEFDGILNLNVPVNFTAQGSMKLVGVFSGHNHLDRLIKNVDGLVNITSTAAYPDYTITEVEPTYVRNPTEYNEFALDMVVIDKVQRKVFLKRYGVGSDREFTY
ncbi:metallophosphoesterase family protein [Bacillus sp. T33-2]|uniref:metallophosphoesterase family protein n=1 Tax=Bacillus sp. T33-2 TaxID=2054168 RepID=UPI000C75A631|nr:metallophosphoesterase [Bacillus sp. T33-2]PLR99656.1 hypothetical protein CVD19_00930 [Bacillus sp. T33-2]